MSYYEFFVSCLRTTKEKYQELVNTPRARGGNLSNELKEIKEQIKKAEWCEDITAEQARFLTSEFNKIDFDNLSKARAANKEREKYDVGHRINH